MAKGNRPADVCGLCDRAIEGVGKGAYGFDSPGADHHRYLGPGWVHGGGRESIAVHWSCATATPDRLYRVPGWVLTDQRAAWIAEWEARTGPFVLQLGNS